MGLPARHCYEVDEPLAGIPCTVPVQAAKYCRIRTGSEGRGGKLAPTGSAGHVLGAFSRLAAEMIGKYRLVKGPQHWHAKQAAERSETTPGYHPFAHSPDIILQEEPAHTPVGLSATNMASSLQDDGSVPTFNPVTRLCRRVIVWADIACCDNGTEASRIRRQLRR